jgi:hypothetical protein
VIGGLVVSLIAVTVSQYQHGLNIRTVGLILMIVGAVGALLSVPSAALAGTRRHPTVVEDGRGNVVRREDTYI